MANLALVTADKTHAAYTTTKTALEDAGHTVTGFAMTEVTGSNLAAFDAIVCVRCLTSGTGYAAFVTNLKAYHATSHKPILLGHDAAGAGTNITIGLPIELKLATSMSSDSSYGVNVRASAGHPIWAAAAVTPPADVAVTSSTNWMTKFNTSAAIAGTVIGLSLIHI